MALAKDIMGGGLSAGSAIALGGQVNTALAAAGSAQGSATAITASNTIVTGADGTKGVILPAVQPGESVVIVNNSGSSLKVYPPVGSAIAVPASGMGSANAAYTQTTYSIVTFLCLSATQWVPNKSA